MKTAQMIQKLQGVYGEYRPGVMEMVIGYLEQFDDRQRDMLFRVVIEDHSTKYRYQPDVAAMRESAKRARIGTVTEGRDVYRDGKHIGHYDGGQFIPNLARLSRNGYGRYLEDRRYQSLGGFVRLLKEDQTWGLVKSGDD